MGTGRWIKGGALLAVLGSSMAVAQGEDPVVLERRLVEETLEQIKADPQQARQYLLAAGGHADYRDRLPPDALERLLQAASGSDREFARAARELLRQDPAALVSLYTQLAERLTPAQREVLEEVLREQVLEGRLQVTGEGAVYRAPSLWKKIALGGGVAAAAGLAGGGGGGGGGGSSQPAPESEPEPEPEHEPFSPPVFPIREAYSVDYRHAMIGTMQAHDRDYDGSGVLLGILDTGFRTSHGELDGQFVDYYNIFTRTTDAAGVADVDGHGTHVAGLIGARLDGSRVTGVAPGARLIGVRIGDEGGELSGTDTQLAAGVDYAVAAGAQFVNNSWGFQAPVNQVSARSFAGWQPELLRAYRDAAAADRVMVFSNGNKADTYPDEPMVTAGLPVLFPELAEHWVAVGAVGPDGVLASYSQPCGSAAAWCLVAPGGDDGEPIISAYHTGDTDYATAMGTSMAAPLVTGGLAVLKQRFPTLDNARVVDRLLLTANREGIYADSSLYGQGLLDLDRATDPLGPLSVVDPATSTRGGSEALPLDDTRMRLSPAWGDALTRALSGRPLAVADSQGAGFFVDLGSLTQSPYRLDTAEALDRYQRHPAWQSYDLGRVGQLQFSLGPESGPEALESLVHGIPLGTGIWRYGLSAGAERLTGNTGHALAGSYSAAAFELPFFDRQRRFWGLSYAEQSPERRWSLALLLPRDDDEAPAAPRLAMASIGLAPAADLQLDLQLGVGREGNALLGGEFSGGFALEEGARLAFTGLNAGWRASEATRLFASGYLGYTRPEAGEGVISDLFGLVTSRFALGVAHQLDEQRKLGLMVSQPLRIERGEMALTVATGYEGNRFNRRQLEIDLTPRARQLDYELFYRWQGEGDAGLRTSLVHQVNPGHRRATGNTLLLFSAEHRF